MVGKKYHRQYVDRIVVVIDAKRMFPLLYVHK